MNLISPESAQLFRLMVGAIITLYTAILLWNLRQILYASTLSYIQKTCWSMLIVFLPFWGIIIYYLYNSKRA
jgi:drug/metabolite transporter (DMT)-like permease